MTTEPDIYQFRLLETGELVRAQDCVMVDSWTPRRPTLRGTFLHSTIHKDGSRTIYAVTADGLRSVPERMVHPCSGSNGEVR